MGGYQVQRFWIVVRNFFPSSCALLRLGKTLSIWCPGGATTGGLPLHQATTGGLPLHQDLSCLERGGQIIGWSCLGVALGVLLMGCSPASTTTSVGGSSLAQGELLRSQSTPFSGQMLPISALATMAGKVIHLEVTRTPQQQAMGLMYRTSLPDDRGMLFEFSPPQPVSFWMKNVKINLDMVFIRQGVVKAIASNVPPCAAEPCPTYGPATSIDQVIELRGGRAAQLGLKVGDRVTIEFLPNPPRR